MEEKYKIIKRVNFLKLLEILSKDYNVVIPWGEEDYLFKKFDGDFTYNKYRSICSLRQFLLPSYQIISTYFNLQTPKRKPFCIIGIKNCDLTSLKIQDFVFIEDDIDPDYQFFRSKNFIISSDCTSCKPVCFCNYLNINPYPEESFDLNLSPIDEGYLIEIGSPKGKNLIEDNSDLFLTPEESYLQVRENLRKEVLSRLELNLKERNLPHRDDLYNLIKKGYQHSIWEEQALKCVECGACVMNCPTCHCFLLFDEMRDGMFIRARIWDGCQYKNFARVAGGPNPLMFRIQRLRNRYIKKFEFFPDHIQRYACTGCGRCIEGCPAKIDLREVFINLAKAY
jgi:ferredoxin